MSKFSSENGPGFKWKFKNTLSWGFLLRKSRRQWYITHDTSWFPTGIETAKRSSSMSLKIKQIDSQFRDTISFLKDSKVSNSFCSLFIISQSVLMKSCTSDVEFWPSFFFIEVYKCWLFSLGWVCFSLVWLNWRKDQGIFSSGFLPLEDFFWANEVGLYIREISHWYWIFTNPPELFWYSFFIHYFSCRRYVLQATSLLCLQKGFTTHVSRAAENWHR